MCVLWSLSSLNLVSFVPLGDAPPKEATLKTEDFTGHLCYILAAFVPRTQVSCGALEVGAGKVVFPAQGGTLKLVHLTYLDELEL